MTLTSPSDAPSSLPARAGLSKDRPVLILGTGGHARVIADTLLAAGEDVLGFTDPAPQFGHWRHLPCLGGDEVLREYGVDEVLLANGIGFLPFQTLRERIYRQFTDLGYRFTQVIHPSAVIAAGTEIAAGVQILAGAIVQTGCRIGENSLLNTAASADHDCVVAEHCHIAPGATLCGGVRLARGVLIGTKAAVIQEIAVGADTIIGAGVTLTRSISADQVVRSPVPVTAPRRR
ncbi:MAG TPA: sugar acetyltransferase [Oceanospirillales bacterium]|nr:sugar acetyltransferase [Oceanospirillaceae bacterium]HBS42918.1 sugar acetyltransferase [Oceanospirillales bacterium]|tara:strand:- start:33371 stop:34069 length:699 start_codon:yes stop_codon:yes gene_type:complete